MNVKEPFLSNCEKEFIKKAISGGIRHDGRAQYDFRDININFGMNYGSVHVCMGETRILAETTCEIQQPKLPRPHEGVLAVFLDLGPMAAPHFEMGRQSDLGTLTSRALEKCLKDSKVINLESLCIRVGAKVWYIRLDLNVLNWDGNLVDAASIAAITSLAHFRRPDVTVVGNDITIHTFSDKDPIPLIVQHYPIYATYAFFNNGERIIADPTVLEERIAEGQISLAVNAYKELCGLHFEGSLPVDSNVIERCAVKAAVRAKEIVELIKEKLKQDEERRANDEKLGFDECLRLNKIPSYSQQAISFKLHRYKKSENMKKESIKEETSPEKSYSIKQTSPHTAELIREENVIALDSESDSSVSDCEIVEKPKEQPMEVSDAEDDHSDGSEEDEVLTL